MPIVLHQPNYYHKKWRQSPVLPPRFPLLKKSNNCHSNLALETEGFSLGGTISLPLLKAHYNTLYCMPITGQYNYLGIYCLFCTLVWQVLIRMEFNLTRFKAEWFWIKWIIWLKTLSLEMLSKILNLTK